MRSRTATAVLSSTLTMALTVGTVALGTVVGVSSAQAVQPAQDRIVSADPANYTPHVLDGDVLAVAVVGNKVVLGGDFTRVQASSGGTILTRNSILAFDRTTGAIDTSFVPAVDGKVRTLAPAADGQSVYVGGQFNNVNGTATSKVARLNIANGAKVAGFNAGLVNALVYDLKLANNRLFIGGQFTQVNRQNRSAIAELNPATGALVGGAGPTFAGVHNPDRGGPTFVYKFDVNPDGQTLAAIGQFTTVGGQPRVQAAMLDIATTTPTLTDWRTTGYEPMCYSVFDYYVRDIEYSPDGEYFAISTTGGFGSGPPTLCDTATRWDADARGQAIAPEWVAYTGGDSSYAMALTDAAIYIGGHQRWWNNPFAADAAGPGAVERTGIAALDPENGLPFSWNPSRSRGRGVFDMVATSTGLWVGSDTDRIGNFEYHGRIAFFPLAGGTVVPDPDPAALPVDAYVVGSAAASPYLSRVNAGGSALLAADNGPDWAVDSGEQPSGLHNSGANSAGWGPVATVDASVPGTTPRAVFDSERWDPGGGEEMEWNIPATVGADLEVRLYFANRCDCTQLAGTRIFDVSIDGALKLDNYDIVADVGHNVGTMKAFPVTSDGNVDIDFGHVVENPLVNAIEVVDLNAPPAAGITPSRWGFDGDNPGAISTAPAAGIDWSTVRGAFHLDGKLYTASSDGTLSVRSYNGSTAGSATTLDLHGLAAFSGEMAQMTGLFYSEDSIYFTLLNDPNLYRRYFTVESGIVGAQRFTVGNGGVDWRAARGMFLSQGNLYWTASGTGDLHRIGFAGSAPVAGSDTVVSGPSNDGRDWRGRAMFALPGTPANQAPQASFTSGCSGTTCSFDAKASSDPEGGALTYAWTFGDGSSGTNAVTQQHTYAGPGSYTVTLTVTDSAGATATKTGTATVVASSIQFVGSAQHTNNASATVQRVTLPPSTATGDQLVLTMSFNSGTATAADPAGWTRSGENKAAGITMIVWTRSAPANAAGSVVSVTMSQTMKSSLTVGAYRGATVAPDGVSVARETVSRAAHTTPVVTAPAGSWVVSSWADKTAATTAWTAPAGDAVRQTGAGTSTGHIAWLLSDSGAAVSAGPAGGKTATADSATVNAVMATVVLAPTP